MSNNTQTRNTILCKLLFFAIFQFAIILRRKILDTGLLIESPELSAINPG